MNKKIPHIIALAAITGLLAIAPNTTPAQTTDPLLTDSVDQSEFPQVTAQPVDQVVPIGSNAVLSVQAINADGYQWLRNGVPVDGQTNSSLIVANAGTNDVGLYSCEVSKDAETVPTRAASVSVVAASSSVTAASLPGGGPITVYGTPYPSGGSKGGCPGPYVGYVNYTKTISQGWGWTPTGTVHKAADGSGRTDTKIEYVGAYGDSGCNQTIVIIPNPTYSPAYRFTIYFANNVPTNAYPITLTGFNP
jgi:hypothetical protein